MTRSKVSKSGNSQAVRIPQELALPYGEVEIVRQGETLVITPIAQQNGAAPFDALAAIEGPIEREQPVPNASQAAELAQAYRDSAAELLADPLFDADPSHGLTPSTEETW